jgi:hypothetical protein
MRTIDECAEFIENVTGSNMADNDLADTIRAYANATHGIPLPDLETYCQAIRDGRCEVFPCKPIDEKARKSHGMYVLEYYFIKEQIVEAAKEVK